MTNITPINSNSMCCQHYLSARPSLNSKSHNYVKETPHKFLNVNVLPGSMGRDHNYSEVGNYACIHTTLENTENRTLGHFKLVLWELGIWEQLQKLRLLKLHIRVITAVLQWASMLCINPKAIPRTSSNCCTTAMNTESFSNLHDHAG